MGAHQHALAALHAEIALPQRHVLGDVALLPAGRAGGPGAITGDRTDGQFIALALQQGADHLAHEGGGSGQGVRTHGLQRRQGLGQAAPVEAGQMFEGGLHSAQIHRHHRLPLGAVGVADRGPDPLDRLRARQHTADGEKAHLHHRVDMGAHASLAGHPVGIDHPDVELFGANRGPQRRRQPPPALGAVEGTVEQQRAALHQASGELEAIDEIPLMAGHQRGTLHQVGGTDRPRPEAQMRHRHRAGLLRVVDEVGLHEQLGALADDLDRALVAAHGAIGAQAIDDRPHLTGIAGAGPFGSETGIQRQRAKRHIVVDADTEMVQGPAGAQILAVSRFKAGNRFKAAQQVIADRLHHRRRELLRGQPIAPPQHLGQRELGMQLRPGLGQGRHHLEVERFTHRTGLLATIEHGDGADAGWQRRHEQGRRKRAKQAHLEQPHPFTGRLEQLQGLRGGLAAGAHQHQHPLSVGGPHVLIGLISAAGEGGKGRHRLLHLGREGLDEAVHRFPALEVGVRVLGGAAQHRMLRAQGPAAMLLDPLDRQQLLQHRIGDRRHLLDFVGGAEAVEHVHGGQAPVEAGPGGDGGEVAGLLHRGGTEHGTARTPHRHHIAVIAEDRQPLGRQRPGGHLQHHRRQLPRPLVEVGDHQQQPLAGGEGGGQRSHLQRPMHSAGSTAFTLQLHHRRHRAPEVGTPLGAPGVGPFPHR